MATPKPKTDVYQEVTDAIVASLAAGSAPWRKPWRSMGSPRNGATGREHRGVNVLLLTIAGEAGGYNSNNWVTFNQAMNLGGFTYEKTQEGGRGVWMYDWRAGSGFHPAVETVDENGKAVRERGELLTIAASTPDTIIDSNGVAHPLDKCMAPKYGVNKGEKGTHIIFWKLNEYAKKDATGAYVRNSDGTLAMDKVPMVRFYSVFNVDQCTFPPAVAARFEWADAGVPPEDYTDVSNTAAAEAFADYLGRENIAYSEHGDRAYYSPKDDAIVLPQRVAFLDDDHYCATRFHEAVHSTGHPHRQNRFEVGAAPSRESYSFEELVAEIGASMCCAATGVNMTDDLIENAASYCRMWATYIKSDPRAIVRAASQAQKATETVLGIVHDEGGDSDA